MKLKLDMTFWILLTLVLMVALYAWWRDPRLPLQGLQAGGRLFGNVWSELLLGFVLAGLIEVLMRDADIARWVTRADPAYAILVGWVGGLLLPGGPYVFFPVAAALMHKGASPALLITLLTAKTLASPVRMLTYEAPLLGWPLTLARFLPSLLLPPLVGLLGHWLYGVFGGGNKAP